MYTIAIYGTGHNTMLFLKQLKLFPFITIKYFVLTRPEQKIFHNLPVKCYTEIDFNDFDYLIVTPNNSEDIWKNLSTCPNYQNAKALLPNSFFKLITSTCIDSHIFFDNFVNIEQLRNEMPFFSAGTQNGLSYISTNHDLYVLDEMRKSKESYSSDEVDLFFELQKKYYPDNTSKVFFDIGGNIGTTSIYAKKIKDPTLRIIAVEPDPTNIKSLKCNCILNDISIEIEEYGISNQSSIGFLSYDNTNSGNTRIELSDNQSDCCSLITLDELMAQKALNDIGYIWMDTQGFEVKAVLGASKTLSLQPAFYMEFSPTKYTEKEEWKAFKEILSKNYSKFIDINLEYTNGIIIEHSISELDEWANRVAKIEADWPFSNLFFIR